MWVYSEVEEVTNLIILKDVPKRYVYLMNKHFVDWNIKKDLESMLNHKLSWVEWLDFEEKSVLELLELSIWLHQEIDNVEKHESEVFSSLVIASINEEKYTNLINFLKTSYKNNQVISKGQIKRLLIQLGERV